MVKYSAVIDTNILFAGLYSNEGTSFKILNLIEQGKIVPLLSTTLVFEYEDVLKRKQKQLELSNREVEDILNAICEKGEEKKIHFIWRPQLRDPKDDHVLELAVAANCADIITFNIKDFFKAQLFGVRVLRPIEVLEELK
jgi:putative PIN family toxin of toxin-antitoxin system